MVYWDAAHGTGGGMIRQGLAAEETKVSFVDKCGGLQIVRGVLATELAGCHTAQFTMYCFDEV